MSSDISHMFSTIVVDATVTNGGTGTGSVSQLGYHFLVKNIEINLYVGGNKINPETQISDIDKIRVQIKAKETNLQDNPAEIFSFSNLSKLPSFEPFIIEADAKVDFTFTHTQVDWTNASTQIITVQAVLSGKRISDAKAKQFLADASS